MGAAIIVDTPINGADSSYANILPSIKTGGGGGAIPSTTQQPPEHSADQAQAQPLPDPPAFLHHLSSELNAHCESALLLRNIKILNHLPFSRLHPKPLGCPASSGELSRPSSVLYSPFSNAISDSAYLC